jgi:hypothetical protein
MCVFAFQLAARLFPWALVIHLVLAVWMYGDTTNLVSGPVNIGSDKWEKLYVDFVEGRADWDKIGLIPKLLRDNVFPIAVLLVFYVVVLGFLWHWVIKPLTLFIGCACAVAAS